MRFIRYYKKVITSATLFQIVVGLFLLCHGSTPLPALADNHNKHSEEQSFTQNDNFNTHHQTMESLINASESLPMETDHDNHLLPCCYEKTEPTQKVGIENALSESLIALASWPINITKLYSSATLGFFAQDPPKSLDNSIEDIVKQE
ncbi:hypothetical protein COT94_03635 [Candidatus Falkowbacteria bacterium CG10_big_fil_rev_8_21_14_0_10_37_14]|uniref:Uncharacterized protein n=1 Tax=Candidatus Falkowbacteria bacterium CG10_big_fil_rev_8_21_14_0_10_37_14 TaxID=1974561 RepID=A0A2M6WST8_9BACT|nr:hypothetical protein [Candidatus Falkowbacteria bacterium]PIT95825.1 MAG: hypothetical protein COT94_03635 [Candidatus Falkowbacteria bacterium CG10_big_fil_rev_8_21_14_0_10_37_14]